MKKEFTEEQEEQKACSCEVVERHTVVLDAVFPAKSGGEGNSHKSAWHCKSCGREYIPKSVGDSLSTLANSQAKRLKTAIDAADAMISTFITIHKMMDLANVPRLAKEAPGPVDNVQARLRWLIMDGAKAKEKLQNQQRLQDSQNCNASEGVEAAKDG